MLLLLIVFLNHFLSMPHLQVVDRVQRGNNIIFVGTWSNFPLLLFFHTDHFSCWIDCTCAWMWRALKIALRLGSMFLHIISSPNWSEIQRVLYRRTPFQSFYCVPVSVCMMRTITVNLSLLRQWCCFHVWYLIRRWCIPISKLLEIIWNNAVRCKFCVIEK